MCSLFEIGSWQTLNYVFSIDDADQIVNEEQEIETATIHRGPDNDIAFPR